MSVNGCPIGHLIGITKLRLDNSCGNSALSGEQGHHSG
ncbi:hypothetical protein AALB_3978 [Agarivorans albus MKT 106]|uniref:Uncharacterized protein n=1 Tax=Agarivorans albus MKT 106 TaxID=1331007 RepID=R9PRK3_AGAAL|nr:hypothetical protein AALB_3978 [Agarivorans albus MKT 106]